MTSIEFTYALNASSRLLKPFAMKLTKDYEDANDLLQETLIKAFLNRDKFTEGTNFKAWLYTIMKNTFITNYQRMVRKNTFIDTTDNLHFINTPSSMVDNGAYTAFAVADIKKAIAQLDEIYRKPFMMHFEGFKYHEIAHRLQLPIGTVKNRIHIARKELKAILEPHGYR